MEQELGKQLLIRGTKGSRNVTLTEEGMILRKRAEEILEMVKKAEKEVTLSDSVVMGDVYIGTGETDAVRLIAKKQPGVCSRHIRISAIISPAAMRNLYWNVWIRD